MKDDSNLRVILAIVISFVFIAVYGHFFSNTTSVSNPQKNVTEAQQNSSPKLNQNQADIGHSPVALQDEGKIISQIKSDSFEIDVDTLGRISQVYLKDKKYTANARELGFFDHIKILFGMMKKPEVKDKLPLLQYGSVKPLEMRFQDEKINKEAFETPYVASKKEILMNTNDSQVLVLTQRLKEVEIKKILTFHRDLSYDIQIQVSDPRLTYFITNGARPITDMENYAFNGVILEKNDEKIEKIEDKDAKDSKEFSGVKFIASVDRYFTTLFFEKKQSLSTIVDGDMKKNPIPYVYAKGELELGGYIGPKDYGILQSIQPSLKNVIEYGMMTFFAKPLFLLLNFLHQYIGNWGWAIIVLTIIVKLILYPLSFKGMVSMQKLKELTPKMKEIQEKYKGDPQKLQAHMMQLYKKHGANPLGGCLPLIIQIPIFYSIYRVLYNSVELKSAEFILWIHDLSAMDPFFVLPILMGASMFLQQHLTPSGITDPMQAKVFKMLPVIFTVFLIFFPAGLVLYWTINNILSILQQLSINYMLERKKQQEITLHRGMHKDEKN